MIPAVKPIAHIIEYGNQHVTSSGRLFQHPEQPTCFSLYLYFTAIFDKNHNTPFTLEKNPHQHPLIPGFHLHWVKVKIHISDIVFSSCFDQQRCENDSWVETLILAPFLLWFCDVCWCFGPLVLKYSSICLRSSCAWKIIHSVLSDWSKRFSKKWTLPLSSMLLFHRSLYLIWMWQTVKETERQPLLLAMKGVNRVFFYRKCH